MNAKHLTRKRQARIAYALECLGLTSYEASTYVAMLKTGKTEAAGLASAAGIPRTSIYKILSSLADKGFVKQRKKIVKSVIFWEAVPPAKMARNLRRIQAGLNGLQGDGGFVAGRGVETGVRQQYRQPKHLKRER